MRTSRSPKKRKNGSPLRAVRHALIIGLLAFVLAVLAGLASQTVVGRGTCLPLALALLLVVILIGIVFDVVGVAAMAANESPFHAMAANDVFGSHAARRLVRQAHRVASICNDVVGDVTGALSGAIGVSILFHMARPSTPRHEIVAASLMTAAVAALTVAGKAYAKELAIRHNVPIMLRVGQLTEAVRIMRGRRRPRLKDR